MIRPASLRAVVSLSALVLAAAAPASAGTWTKVLAPAPSAVNGLVLLGDGTIMAAKNNGSTIGRGWVRLTPNATGSYVNGTWTTLADMSFTRLYYATQVLKDGRVFVAGGEYGTGGPHAELYDPQTNVWTQIDPPAALWNAAADNFVDAMSDMLEDGRVMVMPVSPHSFGIPLLYDPATNTWANAGQLKHNMGSQVEATWVKLPDHTILTIDPFSTKAERYFEFNNTWNNDGPEPVQIYDSFVGEMGGAMLLPTGKALFLGATGHNVLYTPSGGTLPGTWLAAPDFPNGQGCPDAPCAMMVDGHMLCATSATPSAGNSFPAPTSFYEYDPFANSFTQLNGPTGLTDAGSSFPKAMLALPDGSVLYSHMGKDLYIYRTTGAPLAAGKPAVTTITPTGGASYHLVGTGLNGISQGASYGDDLQLNTNYPMVRLSSGANVWYARSHHWSSTGVMTGATPVSTEFDLPALLPAGNYMLEVVANGIASDPVPFTKPSGSGWSQLGFGLPGLLGVPVLLGTGTLVPGSSTTLDLTSARPATTAVLFTGLVNNPTPFKGGFIVPVPFVGTLSLVTDVTGALSFPFSWPAGIPPGTNLFFQYAISDFAAIKGTSISNALQATTP